MLKPSRRGLSRIWCACGYSCSGLRSAWKREAAFRQEVLLAAVLIPVGIWIGETGAERALLCGSLALVVMVELLNSAIESVVDRFGSEWHELCGCAKDMGSAAVLVSLLAAAGIWALILWDRLPDLLKTFQ